jgi:hypothetical protein
MANPAGESIGEALRLDFDRRLTLQFRGSFVTSDASLFGVWRSSAFRRLRCSVCDVPRGSALLFGIIP